MAKILTHIDCPKDWQIRDGYDSHRPMLWLVLKHNTQHFPIAEFGCGEGSTPLLREYCRLYRMAFASWETDKEWAKKIGANHIKSYKNL